jgi:hypothetical protein
MGVLVDIVLTVDWIGGGNDTTSGVQRGMNTSFGNGDRLLFHDFVNGDSIDFRHLVKFIDTHYSSVG